MSRRRHFIPWDSQTLESWAGLYGDGFTVGLDGGQTHYAVRGEGPELILLHGFFFDHLCWVRNIDALARHYMVFALDLWGFGYSTRKPMAYSYSLYARQVLEFMDRLGIETAVLVGQSLGAGAAIEFCVRYPERVRGLVLVSAAGLPNREPLSASIFKWPGVGELLLRLPLDLVRRCMLDKFFLHKQEAVSPALFQRLVQSQKVMGSSACVLAIMRLGFADKLGDTISQLARIPLPVLIIWGEKDNAIPLETGLKLHTCLPGSEFRMLAAAGHVPNLEQADAFNILLTDFLGRKL